MVSGTGSFSDAHSPTATVSGLSVGDNVFKWTVSNGVCTPAEDTVKITRDAQPTSDAGPDQEICATSTTLAGNAAPAGGQGTWSVVSGTGSFSDAHSPTATVSGLSVGDNVFKWTVSNGVCTPAEDTVKITRDEQPTSDAGPDQEICATSTTLAGNAAPAGGQGTWSVVSGTGSFSDAHSPTATVSGLSVGDNVFKWTVSNGVCTAAEDTVKITRDAQPTSANAGPNQQFCEFSSTTLAGNATAGGETGTWSVVSGSGSFANANDPHTMVSGLGYGANIFKWTISNTGVCPPSTCNVTITRDQSPGTAIAGPDQMVCAVTSATLAGNAPAIGQGTWSVVAGAGDFSDVHDPNATVSSLSTTEINTLRWTFPANGTCSGSFDDVNIATDANCDGIPDSLACVPASSSTAWLTRRASWRPTCRPTAATTRSRRLSSRPRTTT